jgi:hypothetical protein
VETQENPLGLDGAYWAAAIASSLLLGVFGASYAAWVAWKRGWQAPLVIFGTFAVLWTVVVAVALVVR